ncbi:UNVERIFIED_CONTAM: glycosyltransferase family 2 protein, partial [Escherichia coli]
VLREYEAKDKRINVVYRQQNGHISAASNSALEIAKGDFVALLDHDDALPEHALLFMAQAICAQPETQILYSDEDKLNGRGERFDPHFKSDWNPDLFFSQNYVSHLGVYRRNLLQRIGGFRLGVEGSQDQDLLLRCLPHVQADQIVHIPRVLYHWRAIEGSTALASGEKSYTTDAGIKALRDYFATQQAGVEVDAGLVPNTYRVRYPIPEPAPLVSLLIPTRDRRSLTETAVRSILEKSTYTNFEILILDNGSVEAETLEFFREIQLEDRRVKVLAYDFPFNYSAINNFGARHAKGTVIGLVNNDIEVINPEWLTEMVSQCLRPEIGCVGAKLYYSNDTVQHAGVILSLGDVAGHSHKHFPRNHPGYFHRLSLVQTLSAVTAACLLIRKEIFDLVSGLDEKNLKVAFNDVDFCLKVREAGYRNLWTPYAELYHYESISRGAEDSPEKIARFTQEVNFMKAKWTDYLERDPFYSPNLTKNREDFSI